jgi:uncharacterized protein YjiS (DUF1127 family)
MWGIARAASPQTSDCTRTAGTIWNLISVVHLAFEVRRERRMLLGMDDRELKDMGFNRGDAYAEAYRPFWDIPADRLCR